MSKEAKMVLAMILFLFPMEAKKLLQRWNLEEKNKYSHRRIAMDKLIAFFPKKHVKVIHMERIKINLPDTFAFSTIHHYSHY